MMHGNTQPQQKTTAAQAVRRGTTFRLWNVLPTNIGSKQERDPTSRTTTAVVHVLMDPADIVWSISLL